MNVLSITSRLMGDMPCYQDLQSHIDCSAMIAHIMNRHVAMRHARDSIMLRPLSSAQLKQAAHRDGIDPVPSVGRHLVMPKGAVSASVGTAHRLLPQGLLCHDL